MAAVERGVSMVEPSRMEKGEIPQFPEEFRPLNYMVERSGFEPPTPTLRT